jgi:hypothetical protein
MTELADKRERVLRQILEAGGALSRRQLAQVEPDIDQVIDFYWFKGKGERIAVTDVGRAAAKQLESEATEPPPHCGEPVNTLEQAADTVLIDGLPAGLKDAIRELWNGQAIGQPCTKAEILRVVRRWARPGGLVYLGIEAYLDALERGERSTDANEHLQ